MTLSSKNLIFVGNAGQTVTESCAEQIWFAPITSATSIEVSLSNNLANVNGGSGSIAWNDLKYQIAPSPSASPAPVYTPAVNYATDGNAAGLFTSVSVNEPPICVNMEVIIPAGTAAGVYSAMLGFEYFTGDPGASPKPPPSASPSPTPIPTAMPSAIFAAPLVGNQNYLLEFPIGGNGNIGPSTEISDPSATDPLFANPTDAVLAPNGSIVVSTEADNGAVWLLPGNASGQSTPTATILNSLFLCPRSVAVDSTSDIYVLDGCGNNYATAAITKFPAGSTGTVTAEQELPAATNGVALADELFGPEDIASLSDGTLYVAQDVGNTTVYGPNGVLEFSPTANGGGAAPEAIITGSNTDVGYPGSVAVDGSGNIYVLTRDDTGAWPFLNAGTAPTNPRVVVYAAGSTGNATPTATLEGSNTLIQQPIRIRVDSNGDIYVADLAVGGILYFPAGSNGNIAPTNIISGSNTMLGIDNLQFVGI